MKSTAVKQRVVGRTLARTLTEEEMEMVAGGGCTYYCKGTWTSATGTDAECGFVCSF
jgi:hypothetical protein